MPSILPIDMRRMVTKEATFGGIEGRYISLGASSERIKVKRKKSIRRKQLLCLVSCAQPADDTAAQTGGFAQSGAIRPTSNPRGTHRRNNAPLDAFRKERLDKGYQLDTDKAIPDTLTINSDGSSVSSGSLMNKLDVVEKLRLFLRPSEPSPAKGIGATVADSSLFEEGCFDATDILPSTAPDPLLAEDDEAGHVLGFPFFCSSVLGDMAAPRDHWFGPRLLGAAPERRVRFQSPPATSIRTRPRTSASDVPVLFYTEEELDEMADINDLC